MALLRVSKSKYPLNLEILESQMLTSLNTFAMPAQAQTLVRLHRLDGLAELSKIPTWNWSKVQILGGGSNSIFTQDLDLVLHVLTKGRELRELDDKKVQVIVAAGENWDNFVAWCLEQGVYGLENLSWIPGSVGAAPIQNIGAYGVEISQWIDAVQVYDSQSLELRWIQGDACGFAYRDSCFKRHWSHLLITQVRFNLSRVFQPVLGYGPLKQLTQVTPLQLRQEIIALRQAKLPDPSIIANAGSFFKNPVIPLELKNHLLERFPDMPWFSLGCEEAKVPAAWLLQTAGFKGQWYKHFGCYSLQPLVLVHDREQKGSLMEKKVMLDAFIQILTARVRDLFQLELEIEPIII